MAKSGRLELGDNNLRTLQVYLQPLCRAGSWSLRAPRHESDCFHAYPGTYICNIDLILVLFLRLPPLLKNVVYVKKQLFLHILLQNNASWNALYVELHLNINIVYSKVLQSF